MPYLKLDEIKALHFDISSRCNLSCPQCARTLSLDQSDRLEVKDLTLIDFKQFFSSSFLSQINYVYFNGNYGDAIAHKEILELLSYLKTSGVSSLQIVTNGSLRNPDWWSKLATLLNRKSDRVVFSIDGLEDTNHLYRVGSQFSKIIKNATTFINSGGRAHWEYLVFSHNEADIDEAKRLAKELGFKQFKLKRTNRFRPTGGHKEKSQAVMSQQVTPPKNPAHLGDGATKIDTIIKSYGSWDRYIKQTEISCKFQQLQAIFVDFEARLWPCCWTSAPYYFPNPNDPQRKDLDKIFREYGDNFNSLKHHSLEAILQHPWFQQRLLESWKVIEGGNPARISTCGRTCGADYEYSSGHQTNSSQENIDKTDNLNHSV